VRWQRKQLYDAATPIKQNGPPRWRAVCIE
jgi:hypothetical protein